MSYNTKLKSLTNSKTQKCILDDYWNKHGYSLGDKGEKELLFGFHDILNYIIKLNQDLFNNNITTNDITCINKLIKSTNPIDRIQIMNDCKSKETLINKILEYASLFSINTLYYTINTVDINRLKDIQRNFQINILNNIFKNKEFMQFGFIKVILSDFSDYNPLGFIKIVSSCGSTYQNIIQNISNKNITGCTIIKKINQTGRVFNALYFQWTKHNSNNSIIKLFNGIINVKQQSKFIPNKDKFEFILDNWNIAVNILNNPNTINNDLNYIDTETLKEYKMGSIELMQLFANNLTIMFNTNLNSALNIIKSYIQQTNNTNDTDYLTRAFYLYQLLSKYNIILSGSEGNTKNNYTFCTPSKDKGTFLTQIYQLYNAIKKVVFEKDILAKLNKLKNKTKINAITNTKKTLQNKTVQYKNNMQQKIPDRFSIALNANISTM